MPDQLTQYYDYLKKAGADVPPTFESFKSTLSDEPSAKQYYDYLKSNKFDAPDTFDSFANTLGLKKKEPSVPSAPVSGQPSSVPSPSPSQLPSELKLTYNDIENIIVKAKKAYDNYNNWANAGGNSAGTGAPGYIVPKEKVDAAKAQMDAAMAEKDRVIQTYAKELNKPVEVVINQGKVDYFFDGDVFDPEKGRKFIEDYTKKYGGGKFLQEQMLANLKAGLEAKKDEPALKKLVNQELAARGVDKNFDYYQSTKFGEDLFKKQIANQIKSADQLQAEVKQKASVQLDDAKKKATDLSTSFTKYVESLNQAIQSGQMTEQQAREAYNSEFKNYEAGIKSINDAYQRSIRDINVNLKNRYSRIQQEVETIRKSITPEVIQSAIPKEDKQKIIEAYTAAAQKLAQQKDGKRKAADIVGGVNVPGSIYTSVLSRSFVSGFSNTMAAFGDQMLKNGISNDFSKWLSSFSKEAEQFQTGQYGWDTPLLKISQVTGSNLGASLPIMVPTLIVSSVPGLQGVGGNIIGAAVVNNIEGVIESGGQFKESLAKGDDVVTAGQKADKVFDENSKNIGLNILGTMGSLLLLKKTGLGATIKGTTLELIEEIPMTIRQEYAKAQVDGYNKPITTFIKENPDLIVDTIVGTLGQSGAMAGMGKVYTAITNRTASPATQSLQDIIDKSGVEVAKKIVNLQFENGIIDEATKNKALAEVDKIAQTSAKLADAGITGDKSKLLTSLAEKEKALKVQVQAEQDAAVKAVLQDQLTKVQADIKGVTAGATPYITFTLPGGNNMTRVLTTNEFNELPQDQKDEMVKAADKISVTGDDQLQTQLNESKSKLGNMPLPEGAYSQELSNLESGMAVDQAGQLTINRDGIVSNAKIETDKIKIAAPEEQTGVTMNLDGTTYTGGGLVIPVASMNTTQEELTPEMLADFIEQNKSKLGDGETFKVGYYKFPNSNQVSIDLNIVADPKNRETALRFGRMAGQESLFDLDTKENVKTGADGMNPRSFSDEEFADIARSLRDGKLPSFMDVASRAKSFIIGEDETTSNVAEALKPTGIRITELPAAEFEARVKEVGGQGSEEGVFIADNGEIILNKDTASDITKIHEGAHPVMNIIYNTNRGLYDKAVAGMQQAAASNQGIQGAIEFGQQYAFDEVSYNKTTGELIIKDASGSIKKSNVDQGQLSKVVGEAIADKIYSSGEDVVSLSGEELNINGENANKAVINDESLVETIARIGTGDIDINTIDTGFKQALIDLVNRIAKVFGFDQVLNDTDVAAFKKLAARVAEALRDGKDISDIVGKENVGRFEVNLGVQSRLRDGEPAVGVDSNKVARERFDIPNLKRIGGGSDRDVFDLGDGNVLKIAKTARGLAQNGAENDWYLSSNGLLPEVVEAGANYIVSKKAESPTGNKELNKMLAELGKFSQRDFDNKTGELQDALAKYGLEDVLSYDLIWRDFTAKRNWGVIDGKPIHVDGGTYAGVSMLDDYRGVKNLEDSEFRDVYYRSKSAKKQFGDKDKFGQFSKSRDLVFNAGLRKQMTEDGDNYVFFHYSDKKMKQVDPSKFGKNLATGRDERPGVGISMYYTRPDQLETNVPGDYGYSVRIPKDKVYPFNQDPLNLMPQAEKLFKKDYPGQAFDTNKQVGYVTKVAAVRGYPMTVAEWTINGKKGLRAQTTERLTVKPYRVKDPMYLNVYEFKEEFTPNALKKGQFAKSRIEKDINFKIAAFVMKEKAEGTPDQEIFDGIKSVMPNMPDTEIMSAVSDPEDFIRSKFSNLSSAVQENLISRARVTKTSAPVPRVEAGDQDVILTVRPEDVRASLKEDSIMDDLISDAKSAKNKYFDAAQGLPNWIMGIKDITSGVRDLEIRKAVDLSKELKKVAANIGFKDWDTFTKAMKSLTPEAVQTSNSTGIQPWYANIAAQNKFMSMPPAVIPAEVAELPEEIRPYVFAMRGMVDGLTKDLIGAGFVTPEQAQKLESNIGSYLNRAYRLFNEYKYKPSKKDKEEAVTYLANGIINQLKNQYKGSKSYQEISEEAVELANKEVEIILKKNLNPYFKKGEKRDVSILKERKDIPEPIRKLMGEYTDPVTVFVMTVAKQAALRGASQYLAALRNNGIGTMFFEKNDPRRPANFTHEIAGEGSETMSPLNGLYTTPEIAEALEGINPAVNELVSLWTKFVGAVRWGKTVGSVTTQVKNFLSNIGFAVMNGLIYTGKNGKAISSAGKYWSGQITGRKLDDLTQKVMALGLVDQSIGASEIKRLLGTGDMHDIAIELAVTGKAKGMANWIGKPFKALNKAYQLSDDFWKVYAYMNERELVSKAMFGEEYDKLAPEQQVEVDLESSERVKNTWPTYSRVWKGAKYVSENLPIFGNFVSFQAESVRVLGNTFKLAMADIKSGDPAFAAIGYKRLAGMITYVSLRSALTYAAAHAAGIGAAGLMGLFDDDEEKNREEGLRNALPPFMRTGDLLAIPAGDGKYTVYDLSSLDPYGIVFKSLNALTEGREGIVGNKMEPGVAAAMAEFLSGFFEQEMTFKTSMNVANNNNEKTGGQIYTEDMTPSQGWMEVGKYFWNQLKPSTVGMAERLTGDNKIAEVSAVVGARPYEVDLYRSFGRVMSSNSKNFSDIIKEYNAVKYDPKATQAQKDEAEKKAEERIAYYADKMSRVYRQFVSLGADPKKLNEMIANKSQVKSTGWSKGLKRSIKTGEITPDKYLK